MTMEAAQAWAIFFAALGGMVTGVVAVIRQNGTIRKVADIHDQVGTASNGRTLGEVIEANDLTPHDH